MVHQIDQGHPLSDGLSTEARYRALLEALPALVVTTTAAGDIEDISDSYREYTGLTLEQARAWAAHDMIHADDYDQAMRVWSDAIAKQTPMQNEMRLRRHDGSYLWHLVQGKPVFDAQGTVTRWVTVSLDIDARKRAETHESYLAEATARLVSPLESRGLIQEIARLAVPRLADICAIGLFDGTSRTARIETAGADEAERPLVERIHLRGWKVSPAVERTIGEQIAEGFAVYVPRFDRAYIEACASDREQMDAATAIGGRSLICVPLRARGLPIGMATFATTRSGRSYTEHDVTLLTEVAGRLSIAIDNLQLYEELQATAVELQLANNAKDEFLGLVSHELRSPLTTIRGNAELLVRAFDAVSPEDKMAALRDIASESNRLERIVDNLLWLARLDQGQTIEREPVIVARVVEQVIDRHRRADPERTVDVFERGHRKAVEFVPGYLEQVVENLLGNAAKYSPAHEPITIEIERTTDRVELRVLDRGAGIDPAEADHLFEPFYRSDSTSGRAAGLGIGLSVCRRLVEAQGGEIWARPRAGGGAEFGFALPVLRDADPD